MSATRSIHIKTKASGKWEYVPAAELLNKSILQYMAENTVPIVAAIMEDKKPVLFVLNTQEQYDYYSEKAPTFFADELEGFFGSQPFPDIALKVFPDCRFEKLTDLR